ARRGGCPGVEPAAGPCPALSPPCPDCGRGQAAALLGRGALHRRRTQGGETGGNPHRRSRLEPVSDTEPPPATPPTTPASSTWPRRSSASPAAATPPPWAPTSPPASRSTSPTT